MPAIDVSAFLTPGQQYTFSFQETTIGDLSSALPGGASLDTLTAALQNLRGVSQPYAHIDGLTTNVINVTFMYSGDGSDVVADIVQPILDATSGWFGNTLDFVGANSGSAGTDQNAPQIQLPSLSSSSLWAIALIVLLAVFVFSGGAAATRQAIA